MDRLTIARGDARLLNVTLTLDDVDWPPPVGSTLRSTAKIRRTDSDEDAVWTKSTDDGITVVGNVATIELEPEDTDDLAGGSPVTLYCDVQATGLNFGPWTIAQFLLVVEPDVTRTP